MRPRQFAGVADRKCRHLLVPRLPVDFDARYDRQVPDETTAAPGPLAANTATLRSCLPDALRREYRERTAEAADGALSFVGHTVRIGDGDGVDWTHPGIAEPPRLWSLKCYGFEFLAWAALGHDDPADCPAAVETFRRWTEAWVDADALAVGTPGYLRRAWTPYAVSLRLCHRARFYAWSGLERDTPGVAALYRHLLWKDALFLSNHVEHDVGGNHLVENGAALATAGALLESDRLWDEGVGVLVAAGDQFLADGGHFERSPMYHALVLTQYLTALDLARRTGRSVPPEVRRVATEGTRFLAAVVGPDGRIPLLNDSVYGFALPAGAVLDYAAAVGVDPDVAAGRESDPAAMEPSGYYTLDSGASRLLLDGGAVGPPHLPAHSHVDLLSVLLWVDGRPVFTDTGTREYAGTDARQYARSVAAHNTVQYGDVEPIPVGGSFLMGRRVEPTVRAGCESGVGWVDGAYERPGGAGTGYRHRRRAFGGDGWWLVHDTVTADAARPVRSRLHADPACSVRFAESGPDDALVVASEASDGAETDPLVHLVPLGADAVTVSTSPSYPEFGRTVERPSVTLRREGREVAFGFLVSAEAHGSVDLDERGDGGLSLRIDGEARSLPATDEPR